MFLFFSPWFLAVVVYENLTGMTAFIDFPLVDAQLYHLDVLLFGETPSIYLQDLITPALTHFFFAVYLLCYVVPPLVLGGYLFLYKGKHEFSEYSHAVVLSILIGFTTFLFVPAIGPDTYYPDSYEKDIYGNTLVSAEMMEDIQGYAKNTFPSMHTALSTIVLLFSFKNERKIFYVLLPLTILVWISTIYLRQHYFVDLIAGWALAYAAYKYAPAVFALAKRTIDKYSLTTALN